MRARDFGISVQKVNPSGVANVASTEHTNAIARLGNALRFSTTAVTSAAPSSSTPITTAP